MLKKVYVERYAKVGDTVVATGNPMNFGDQIVGYEYTVTRLGHGYVVATSDRLPSYHNEITINDKYHSVVEYKEVQEPKETFVKVYRFLGIPFAKRTTYVYDN